MSYNDLARPKTSWASDCFRQLGLLLWKNYKLQKRSVISTLLEILVPALFALILLPIRRIVPAENFTNITVYDSFSIDKLPKDLSPYNLNNHYLRVLNPVALSLWSFAYQPQNSTLVNNIMKSVGQQFEFKLKGFDDEDSMVKFLTDEANTQFYLGGASFLNESIDNFVYKLRYSYSPRYNGQKGTFKRDLDWKTQFLYFLFPILGPREKTETDGGDPGYFREGFVQVQKAIDFALIKERTDPSLNATIDSVNLELKRFPFPPYNDDKFVAVVAALFPFIIIISFVFTVILTAKAIVYEKETGLKEAMKLMGMKSWIYWLSWYLKTFILLLPSLIFMVVSYKIKLTLTNGGQASIIDKTDPILFLVFFLLYASGSITFTFLCTTFFKKANSAAAGAGVIWFFSYLPYIFIGLRYESMTLFDKVMASFVNNLAMSQGMQLIGQFEGKGVGINFSNWREGVVVDDNFTMFNVMTIMFFNNFLHILLAYYFEHVIPSEHGLTKPWYFPIAWLLPKRWTNSNNEVSDFMSNNKTNELDTQIFIEDEANYSSRNIGIRISNVGKVFKQLGTVKRAVKNLSLNIYEGQISVLLGHNGAGKSTTISMITGLTVPTTGQIFINDHNVVTDTDVARSVLGYCPQHNLLFDDLTVMEHLLFFSKLKQNYNQAEIDEMLELINLADKKNAPSRTLSGGMKRKLSVAIAFIGGSKIVILDEPSSGMDPQARHSVWSLLQKFRKEKECTILLTTHFMDEADFLGDRIAIMSQGELKCCGSPLYLKSKYGSGYNLVITRKREKKFTNTDIYAAKSNEYFKENTEETKEYDASTNRIINMISDTIPNSKLSSNVNSELSFVLPTDMSAQFPDLFLKLDQEKDQLNILNIGISITTVEEVFLKINENEGVEEGQVNEVFTKSSEDLSPNVETVASLNSDEAEDSFGLWTGSNSYDLVYGFRFYMQQFKALFIKRMINSVRNKILIISQLIIPICILIVTLLNVKYGPIKAEDSPELVMNISKYSSNSVPYLMTNETAFVTSLTKSYSNQFVNIPNSEAFDLHDTVNNTLCTEFRQSIDLFLGCVGDRNLQRYIDNYLIATRFEGAAGNKVAVTAYFNNQPYHVPSVTVNILTNGLLKYFTKSNENTITVINHPLPRNIKEQADDLALKDRAGFQIGSGLTFGFSFLIASFAIFLIKEKSSDAKHLQYMSGCNSYVFWISAFLWDMINYIIPCIFVIICLFIFDIEEYVGGIRFIYVFVLLVMYGMAHIPQIYLMSYLFKVSATGFAILSVWNILSSQATMLPVSILELPQLGLVSTANILEWVFLIIFPNFSAGQAFVDMYNNFQVREICMVLKDACPVYPNPCCLSYNTSNPDRCGNSDCFIWQENFMAWEKPGLLRFFIFLPLQFVVMFSIVLIYEAGIFRKISYKLNSSLNRDGSNSLEMNTSDEYQDIPKDSDVINEENRISNLMIHADIPEIFIVNKLTKHYSNFMAVRGISFSIEKAQCFGLLGVNGAGKTSTFKMITGDEFITSGEAYLNKSSLKTSIKNFQKQLGYCPQFDPLIDQMTVMETMIMYARLRGIRSSLIKRTCASLIQLLDLSDHVNKMCYTLSGGNKRKLSVAIALVGSPIVILLDEPTSGMDPKTRRTLWNCLNKIRNKGKSLILTTHGMDETEALCTNIGIMVNGELKCLGSLQHLKSKYGEGYTLLAKIPMDEDNNKQKIKEFIEFFLNSFKDSHLKENRDGFINIHINNNSTSQLSGIFSFIENSKQKYSIEYYVVTQTKLEQIFLNFASKQIDPESRMIPKKSLLSRLTK